MYIRPNDEMNVLSLLPFSQDNSTRGTASSTNRVHTCTPYISINEHRLLTFNERCTRARHHAHVYRTFLILRATASRIDGQSLDLRAHASLRRANASHTRGAKPRAVAPRPLIHCSNWEQVCQARLDAPKLVSTSACEAR